MMNYQMKFEPSEGLEDVPLEEDTSGPSELFLREEVRVPPCGDIRLTGEFFGMVMQQLGSSN